MSENVFVGADSFRRLLLGAAEGYEDGGPRHIPTRGNRQSPDWCPRRKDDAE